jgi:phage terminase large subunit-like protein
LVSVARQNGKTTLMAAVIGWWLATQGSARGRPQVVLSTAHKLDLAAALFKYLAPILEAKLGAEVSRSYGRQELTMPDGSVWIVRAATPQAGHGYSIDLCVVDEAWSVSEECVDEGFAPAQIARPNSLLAMFSTAGTTASKLMLKWREQGLRQIDSGDPGPLYFASWEPPPGIDPMTPEAWAYANPALGRHITIDKLREKAKSPNRNAFLRGHVNLFTIASNAWLEAGLWSALENDQQLPPGGVLAVDASTDESRFMAVRAVKTGDKISCQVEFNVDTQAEMWLEIERIMADQPRLQLAIAASLDIHCPPHLERRRTIVGYRELLRWTLAVRSLIVENKVGHRGEASLAEHVERAVMVKHQGSLAVSTTRSPGDITLARCMIWAVALESKPGQIGKPMLVVTG